MYNLFLDDIRQPSGCNYVPSELRSVYLLNEWEVVRNYEEFVQIIKERGLPKLVSFDHDLADIHYDPETWTESFKYQEKTGMDCAKWLVDYCLDNKKLLPEFLVHSQNPVGAKNILSLLINFKQNQTCQN